MGWASGSYFAEDLYNEIRKYIPKDKRKLVAEKIISAFENDDADDWGEDSKLWKDSGRACWREEDK
jgi:cation transport regulator ChaB